MALANHKFLFSPDHKKIIEKKTVVVVVGEVVVIVEVAVVDAGEIDVTRVSRVSKTK